ncbi:MAG: hypothetical protein V1793_01615, partial [Pseudomonadota bacterium]
AEEIQKGGEFRQSLAKDLTGVQLRLSGLAEEIQKGGEFRQSLAKDLTGVRSRLSGLAEEIQKGGEFRQSLAKDLTGVRSRLSGLAEEIQKGDEFRQSLAKDLTGVQSRLSGLADDIRREQNVRKELEAKNGDKLASARDTIRGLETTLAQVRSLGENSPGVPEKQVPEQATVQWETIEAFVSAWANAWATKNLDRYLACYSSSFIIPGGVSRDAWSRQRRQRILGPGFITVEVKKLTQKQTGPRMAKVEFVQQYRSDVHGDTVVKTLDLAWDKGAWSIVRETSRAWYGG